jgi:hypothetical protein
MVLVDVLSRKSSSHQRTPHAGNCRLQGSSVEGRGSRSATRSVATLLAASAPLDRLVAAGEIVHNGGAREHADTDACSAIAGRSTHSRAHKGYGGSHHAEN